MLRHLRWAGRRGVASKSCLSCLGSLIVGVEEVGPFLLYHQRSLELHVSEQSKRSSVGSVMGWGEDFGIAEMHLLHAQRRKENK